MPNWNRQWRHWTLHLGNYIFDQRCCNDEYRIWQHRVLESPVLLRLKGDNSYMFAKYNTNKYKADMLTRFQIVNHKSGSSAI